MPCRDGGPTDYEETVEKQRRLDKVTRMLCGLCRRVNKSGRDTLITYDAELTAWWADHQAEDRKREAEEAAERAKERARQAVLAKLSPRDRKILGVDKQ